MKAKDLTVGQIVRTEMFNNLYRVLEQTKNGTSIVRVSKFDLKDVKGAFYKVLVPLTSPKDYIVIFNSNG